MKLSIVSDKKSIDEFHKVPDIINKNNPKYIPHIQQDVEKIFDLQKNKLFRQKGKAQRWVLHNEKNQLIGRVAAFVHPKTSTVGEYPVGGMGFFDCIDNATAANLLFDTCKNWLTEQGMKAMDGPINFGEKDQFWGLLVMNFDAMGSYGMNYNPPYYQALFENYGFKNYFEQLVFWRDLNVPAQEVFVKKSNMLHLDSNFSVRHLAKETHEEIASYFLEVYNSAWGGHAGFKAMRIEQARSVVKALKPIMDRDILIFAFYNDKPIGFYINIPELNEFFQYVNGNLNWWGKLKFIYHLKFSPRSCMVGIVFGVSRAFHGRGVEAALIKYAEKHVVPLKRYKETVITWIGDFNLPMLKVIENLGTTLHRKLITYRYLFDESIPFERHPVIGGKDKKQVSDNE